MACSTRWRAASGASDVKIVVVNWQDRENPQAGGAEQHLHEIFGRLAGRGHEVTLLCGGWPGCPPDATLDGTRVLRVGTRHTFPFLVRAFWRDRVRALEPDVLVEDINKVPLHVPRWAGVPPVVAVVPHLFGSTAFQEAPAPLAAAVWLAERSIPRVYRGIPFEAISELLKRLTRRQPLLVVLEDAHWADEMSVRLLAFLGRRLKEVALLLVVTIREEEMGSVAFLQQSLDELDDAGELTRLAVSPLSRADTSALVQALAPPALPAL